MKKLFVFLLMSLLLVSLASITYAGQGDDKRNGYEEDDDDEKDDDDDEKEEFQAEIEGREGKIEYEYEKNGEKIKIKVEYKVNKDGTIERRIEFKGEDEHEVKTKLKLRETIEGNESTLRALLSNGSEQSISLLPERVLEIFRERVQTREQENITLIEDKDHKNLPRVLYQIETNENGKFLGILKTKSNVKVKIDPETGEVIEINRPWWHIFVTKTIEDPEPKKNETKNETEPINNTNETQFNQTIPVNNSLNDTNISN